MSQLLVLCSLFSLAAAFKTPEADEFLNATLPHLIEIICGACLIGAGLYLNYFGRRVFKAFIYLTGAALGAYSSVLITCAVASAYGVKKDPVYWYFLMGLAGALLGSLLLRKLWKFATAAVGAFAGKTAVMMAFTAIPEAVYLDGIVRLILLFLGGLIGGGLALKLERHAVIVATSIFGTFLALFGYDNIRKLKLSEHFKTLVRLHSSSQQLKYLEAMTVNEELKCVLILSIFVIVTGIYTQYRITPKYIDRD